MLFHAGSPIVDLDIESYVKNDHWALLHHSGSRIVRTAMCCTAEAADSVLDDVNDVINYDYDVTVSTREPVYVSLHYQIKLRKKLGPSLLGRRRRRRR